MGGGGWDFSFLGKTVPQSTINSDRGFLLLGLVCVGEAWDWGLIVSQFETF